MMKTKIEFYKPGMKFLNSTDDTINYFNHSKCYPCNDQILENKVL